MNEVMLKRLPFLATIFFCVMWMKSNVGVSAQGWSHNFNKSARWHNWFEKQHRDWYDIDDAFNNHVYNEEYGMVEQKWHQVCNPDNQFCGDDYDCGYDEVCENFECLSMEDASLYGSRCNTDEHCGYYYYGQKLVCCGEGTGKKNRCCHPSEKELWAELACQDNDDCCTANDISYCCKWTAGSLWGTCCTYEQMMENAVIQHCAHTSCDYRLQCCPGDRIEEGYPDYCCTPAEYRLLTQGGDICMLHEECYSGFCCSHGQCCTYEEYETDEGICYQDFDCYRTQKCCYAEHGDNFCCYKDEETQEEVELHWILIVGGVLLFLLVVVITIGCVCCYCVNQNSKNAKKERKNVKKNRVADNPTMMNRNMQEPTFLYTRNNLMNNIPAPICQHPGNHYGMAPPANPNYPMSGNGAPPVGRPQPLLLDNSRLSNNGIPQPPVYNPPTF